MESKIVGHLNSVDYDPDWFESVPFQIPYFNNKKIKIIFIEAKHEPYLLGADNTLQNFFKLDSRDRLRDSQILKSYYDEALEFGYIQPLDIETPEDIWKFVHPNEIIIHWEENGDFYLLVSAGCDWEEEHGLQLVFKEGQRLTKASGHDGDYTD